MENKINIAELLKDCPTGMKLDCTMFDDVTFYGISNEETIVAKRELVNQKLYLDSYGAPFVFPKEDSKCVIFPKGKTTWEGFVPPCKFKAGDVIVTRAGDIGIIKERAGIKYLVNCTLGGSSLYTVPLMSCIERLATKEEKKKLLQAIKNAGYKLNEETKTLEKLIEPKFNINTLKPFDKVLVRSDIGQKWTPDFFGFMDNDKGFPFVCIRYYVIQCIPFTGNEHLVGTTADCEEYYKTWK